MSSLGNHDLSLPFEEGGRGPLPDEAVNYAGGIVVMAATVDVPDAGKKPAIVFRFARPDGTFYPAFVLVADDDQIAKLRPLINGAVAAARREAQL